MDWPKKKEVVARVVALVTKRWCELQKALGKDTLEEKTDDDEAEQQEKEEANIKTVDSSSS